MDMTEQQRADLAARITDLRISRYGGSRKAAYVASGVNSGTWTRAEAGESLAERSLVAIVGTLWPETHGDWRRIDPPLGSDVLADESWRDYIDSLDLTPETHAHIVATIEGDLAAKRAAKGREAG
jgi:phenylpyruvate tautomerase PptA (4-oxalocrotonate tautomerase family)